MRDDTAPWQHKIDHRLRSLLTRTPEGERGHQQVNVLVCFVGPVERLQQLGLQVRSVAGNIASTTLGLADIARVAGSPEVTFIELTQQLTPDAASGSRESDCDSG